MKAIAGWQKGVRRSLIQTQTRHPRLFPRPQRLLDFPFALRHRLRKNACKQAVLLPSK